MRDIRLRDAPLHLQVCQPMTSPAVPHAAVRMNLKATNVIIHDRLKHELDLKPARSTRPRLAERARIVLACADGESNMAVATALNVTAMTVVKWRSRFAVDRLAGLDDQPRPGRRKLDLVLDDAERAQLARWARRATTAQFLALRGRSCWLARRVERTSRSPPTSESPRRR